MYYHEIDHEARVQVADVDLGDSIYGDRTVALEGFATVDGCDLLVPVDPGNLEAMIVALTEAQAMQALLSLAGQIGTGAALKGIEEAGF